MCRHLNLKNKNIDSNSFLIKLGLPDLSTRVYMGLGKVPVHYLGQVAKKSVEAASSM